MFPVLLLNLFIVSSVLSSSDYRTVHLDIGSVKGEKYWNGDFYEFYGIPYATVPTGRDKYKAPLPVKPWEGILNANKTTIVCPQVYLTDGDKDEEIMLYGEEDCLKLNLLVPEVANEDNLVPVIVYIHSGAFAGGNGNMARFHYLARHDVITVSFNYRLGTIGFACLGTEDIPGNAGLKDQLAALKWVNKYIKQFGGDPNKVTLAGFSVGASMAELLAISKQTDGLIEKLILESGSALSPFAINRDPINTAKNIAISVGFNDTGKLKDLSEFLLEGSPDSFAGRSINFFLPNATFGFAPCIENVFPNSEPFLTESPLDIMVKSKHKKIPVLTGFSNMEGISRTIKFNEWSDLMNEKFEEFIPVDISIKYKKEKDNFIKEIFKLYFKGDEVSHDTVQGYIDYFSDSMFKYAIMKSARLHAAKSTEPVFLYEFIYNGNLNMKHMFMDRISGASHRDQSSYILDFFSFTTNLKDMDTRDRMTTMWSDFLKYEDPTAFESSLINVKWLKYTEEERNFLEIGNNLNMKIYNFTDRYQFWDKAYEKYYWTPTPPKMDKGRK